MSEQLKAGDILCFYEVKNPEGNTAGMMVKESHERSIDNYVQWAKSQQITLMFILINSEFPKKKLFDNNS